MANTAIATIKGKFIEIVLAGSGASWDMTTAPEVPAELRALGYLQVDAITFEPSQAGDVCVITEGPGAGGPKIFMSKTILTTRGVIPTDRQTFKSKKMTPYFDMSKSTIGGTIGNASILIELA